MKGIVLGVVIALLVVAAGSRFLVIETGDAEGPTGQIAQQKVALILRLIESNYLQDVDEASITNGMLKGMLEGIDDDYADYYSAEEYTEIKNSTNGDYRGVGMIMQQDSTTGIVTIMGVYEDTPAEQAGIVAGDILVKVDDMVCAETELDDVVDSIKNGEAEQVHMVLSRNDVEYEVDVDKGDIEIPVVGSTLLEDNIGYLRITQFTAQTSDQFAEEYASLQDQGMEAMIVDLRSNPGGLLTSVVKTLQQILPEGLIVYTETKDGTRTEYTCDGDTPIDIPLVVLVNGSTASAAEIFAGAVQDYGVGTLIGTQTYGKGIVQKTFPFTDGSAVKMTIAYYYTPNGTCIHGEGIAPDVEVELPEDATEDVQLKEAISYLQTK